MLTVAMNVVMMDGTPDMMTAMVTEGVTDTLRDEMIDVRAIGTAIERIAGMIAMVITEMTVTVEPNSNRIERPAQMTSEVTEMTPKMIDIERIGMIIIPLVWKNVDLSVMHLGMAMTANTMIEAETTGTEDMKRKDGSEAVAMTAGIGIGGMTEKIRECGEKTPMVVNLSGAAAGMAEALPTKLQGPIVRGWAKTEHGPVRRHRQRLSRNCGKQKMQQERNSMTQTLPTGV